MRHLPEANKLEANKPDVNKPEANKQCGLARPKAIGDQVAGSISRRSFLGFAAVAAATLVVENTFGGAAIALAETVNNAVTYRTIEFIVLSRKQIAFSVFDAKDGITPVPGARVQLYSYATQRAVTATTDSKGVATITVYDESDASKCLVKQADYREDQFDFFAKVVVGKNGWRDFETGQMRFVAGEATGVYLQVDDGQPYARKVTFNDWDIQYAEAEFSSTEKNDAEHELAISIVCPHIGDEAEIKYWTGEARTSNFIEGATKLSVALPADDVGSAPAIAEFSFRHKFLYPSDAQYFLGIEKALHLYFWVERQGRQRIDTKIKVIEGVIPEPIIDPDDEDPRRLVIRYNDSEDYNEGVSIDLPDSFPGLGGGTLNMWLPTFPVKFNLDTSGDFVFLIGWTYSWSKEKDGTDGDWSKDWKGSPTKSFIDQCNSLADNFTDAVKGFDNARAEGKKLGKYSDYKKMSWTFSIYGGVHGTWVKDEKHSAGGFWDGDFSILIQLGFSYCHSMQFLVGPVPLGVEIYFSATAGIKFICGYLSQGKNPVAILANSRLDLSRGEIAIPIKIYGALTVGVGISGVAMVGFRGSVWLYPTLSIVKDAKKPSPDASNLHVTCSYGAAVEFVVQLFVFNYSKELAGIEGKSDSWAAYQGNQRTMEALAAGANPLSVMSLEEADALFEPVSQENLLAASEFVCEFVEEDEGDAGGENASGDNASGETVRALGVSALSVAEVAEAGEAGGVHGASDESYQNGDAHALPIYAPHREGAGVQDVSFEPQPESPSLLEALGLFKKAYAAESSQSLDGTGLAPSVEVRILRDVFSEAHTKIVEYEGKPYLFRLASVAYTNAATGETATTTAVTGATFNEASQRFNEPKVIHGNAFKTSYYAEHFECDFDVCVIGDPTETSQTSDYAHWGDVRIGVVVSEREGKDSESDGITISEAASATKLRAYMLDDQLNVVEVASHCYWVDTSSVDVDDLSDRELEGPVRKAYLMPQISYVGDKTLQEGSNFYSRFRMKVAAFVQLVNTNTLEPLESYIETWDLYYAWENGARGSFVPWANEVRYASSLLPECSARAPFGIDSMEILPAGMSLVDHTSYSHPGKRCDAIIAYTELRKADAQGLQRRQMAFVCTSDDYDLKSNNAHATTSYPPAFNSGETYKYVLSTGSSSGKNYYPRPKSVVYPHADDSSYDFHGEFTEWRFAGGSVGCKLGDVQLIDNVRYHGVLVREGGVPDADGVIKKTGRLNFYFVVSSGDLHMQSDGSMWVNMRCIDAGPKDKRFDGSRFSMNRSNQTLFFATLDERDSPEILDENGAVVLPAEKENLYQVWASRVVDGRFITPFPLGRLSNPIDSIQSINYGSNQYAFIYQTLDFQRGSSFSSRADMYLATIPYTKALSFVSVGVKNPAVSVGDKLHLRICMRNDGNVVLGAFGVKLTFGGIGAPEPLTTRVGCRSNYVPDMDDLSTKYDEPGTPGAEFVDESALEADAAAKLGMFLPGATETFDVDFDVSSLNPGEFQADIAIVEDAYEIWESDQIGAYSVASAGEPLRVSFSTAAEVSVEPA